MLNETAKQPLLLTLKGAVTVHFLDGQTVTGEFSSQDMFNIFLTVDNEPLMIPRSQIRFIKGQAEQPIEPDSSQNKFVAGAGGEITVKSVQTKADSSVFDTEAPSATPADNAPAPFPSPADELMAELDEEEDEDTTVFLEAENDPDVTVFLEEEGTDVTLRFVEDEAGDDDETLTIQEPAPVVTAYFECIAGPHAGERFQLQAGVNTLGRSKENIFALFNDKEVSRRHALITSQPDGSFMIEDRGSLNGVIIDDIRIEGQHQLKAGENILIGVSLFVFHKS